MSAGEMESEVEDTRSRVVVGSVRKAVVYCVQIAVVGIGNGIRARIRLGIRATWRWLCVRE